MTPETVEAEPGQVKDLGGKSKPGWTESGADKQGPKQPKPETDSFTSKRAELRGSETKPRCRKSIADVLGPDLAKLCNKSVVSGCTGFGTGTRKPAQDKPKVEKLDSERKNDCVSSRESRCKKSSTGMIDSS